MTAGPWPGEDDGDEHRDEPRNEHRDEHDEGAPTGGRPPKQITRNWNELLQELRVMQTGVQILTGFLLTVPFTERFTELESREHTIYLCVLVGSVLTTSLIVAPVAFHRVLFRQRQREWLVAAANVCARVGLAGLGLVSSAVVLLVFDVVVGLVAGLVAGGLALVVFAVLWFVVPRFGGGRPTPPPEAGAV